VKGTRPAGTRRIGLIVLVAAVAVLVASVIAAARIVPSAAVADSGTTAANGGAAAPGSGAGTTNGAGVMMNGAGGVMGGASGMMSGRVWLAGDGVPVTSIDAARARAKQAPAAAGLHPGEVIQFTANFYVELKDAQGASVTEALVNPLTRAVSIEPGPAMMWVTGNRAASISEDQARSSAAGWLEANRPGETVASLDAYPG
jgi:hypothetical protein